MFCFVVLSHDRRPILFVNVTANLTAAWTACQTVEMFPYGSVPNYAHRDRDSISGWKFQRCVELLGIDQVVSAPHDEESCNRTALGTRPVSACSSRVDSAR